MVKNYFSAYKIFSKSNNKDFIKFIMNLKKKNYQPLVLHEELLELDLFSENSKRIQQKEDLLTIKNFAYVIKKLDHLRFIKEIVNFIAEGIESRQKIIRSSEDEIGTSYVQEFVFHEKTLMGRINIIKGIIIEKIRKEQNDTNRA